jgi:flagellar hook-length control protein FliK
MTTATILATSNVAAPSTTQHTGAEPLSEGAERFSQVLDRQHDAHAAAGTEQASRQGETKPVGQVAGKQANPKGVRDEERDSKSASEMSDHAAGLPQLALDIAAQVKTLRGNGQTPGVAGRGVVDGHKLAGRHASVGDAIARAAASAPGSQTAEDADLALTSRTDMDLKDSLRDHALPERKVASFERHELAARTTNAKLVEDNASTRISGFSPALTAAVTPQASADSNRAGASRLSKPGDLSPLGLPARSTSAESAQPRTGDAFTKALSATLAAASGSLHERGEVLATAKSIDASALAAALDGAVPGGLAAGSNPTLHGTSLAAAGLVGTGSPASSGIATPLHSPQWSADFGRQFVSLVQGGHNMPHTAELRLDPPELGPLRISINISDNVAHAVFVSPHAAVRQTIEQSLPQLQQLLADAGISLGQASVSDQGQAGQEFDESMGNRNGARATAADTRNAGGLDTSSAQPVRRPALDALVDTFA